MKPQTAIATLIYVIGVLLLSAGVQILFGTSYALGTAGIGLMLLAAALSPDNND